MRLFQTPCHDRRAIALFAVTCLAALLPAQPPPTPVEATRQLLLGNHLFTLQWISWQQFGKATVTDEGGVLTLQGEQRKSGDYVTVQGAITEILPNGFRFQGKVTTRVSYINQGKPCVRDGNFTFLASGTRKFWRMREINNPCDEAADYVDVYFKRP
jgi:hypothetical protein